MAVIGAIIDLFLRKRKVHLLTPLARSRTISHDETAFPDPEKFDPQRWVERDGQIRSDLKSFPFGFGRRYAMIFF
jgi:hypothetical protein